MAKQQGRFLIFAIDFGFNKILSNSFSITLPTISVVMSFIFEAIIILLTVTYLIA